MPHDKPGRQKGQQRQHHNMDGLPIPQIWEDEDARADAEQQDAEQEPAPPPLSLREYLWTAIGLALVGVVVALIVAALQ